MTGAEVVRLAAGGAIPNHPVWPALVHRGVSAGAGPRELEAVFAANGWPPAWRDGIYDFHHFHTRGHEALGVAAGSARVMLGGPGGPVVAVGVGDVLVLPAGTGHCRIEATEDLLIVGAYPPGQSGDICRGPADAAMRARIAELPRPASDPVGAADGLTRLWREADDA